MIDVPIQINNDSSAARSIAIRRGIGGRLRHLQTRHLWLQSRVAPGHVKLDVVAGERNPADTLTKPLPGRKIREWSEHVGLRWLRQKTTTTTNDGKHREGMLDDEHLDGLTRCSTVSSRQTRIFRKLSAVSAVAEAAELVENEPSRLCR